MNIGQSLDEITVTLASAGIENAAIEARFLLSEAIGVSHVELLLHRNEPINADAGETLAAWIRERLRRVPLQYVIGSSCFRDLCLDVGPGVLVPRPETEQLVEWTLKAIPLQARAICDVGTGSGAIALSLAKTRPDWNVVGIDLHAEALQYAVRNQAKLGIGNVHFVQGDLLEPFAADSCDAIVTNPPYVKTAEHRELQEEVRCHEPITALVGGDDGLSCIRSIIRDAVRVLRPGGMLGIEIGESQGVAVCDLLRIGGGFQGISIKNDWNGKERFVFCAKRK